MPVISYLVVGITGLSICSTALFFLYGKACPWTAEQEDSISFYASTYDLVSTICKPLIVFVVLTVAYGFDVIFADVTNSILKIVFGMTFARFLLTKLQQFFGMYFQLMPYLAFFEVIYLTVLAAYVLVYCYMNYKVLDVMGWRLWRQSRLINANQQLVNHTRDQMIYRTRLYLFTSTIICGYCIIELVLQVFKGVGFSHEANDA